MTVDSPQPTVQRLLDSQAQQHTGARPGAKARILETASRLFYEEGIHAVGVDRLIAEASVTKATFYKHYGSKDNLILAYMRAEHEAASTTMSAIRNDAGTPASAIRDWVAAVVASTNRARFRGCAFLNAAAEYHDPRHAVRELVAAHRDWYTEQLADLLSAAGHPLPGDGADELLLARDGAMMGAYAGDPIAATAALNRVANRVLAA
ncbi:TetR/AcrR family transcriptional regulator [Curtobacterium ammoniigenes]|uniref:TetR/AcrR family transcriptional regulator n=1 Tax=Curtobacterium ammoniigenes TaxID=395387 RepID=UPI0008344A81|nr:TetR/AcrR family transcriptional regulator [Curtobacterium ammoniigenes]